MDCKCLCHCDNHKSCRCGLDWCNCLIENRIKKRKRCHCKNPLQDDIMASLSGFFIGQFCHKCGLFGRISEFYSEHKNAMKILKPYSDEVEARKKANGAYGFIDYDDGFICSKCIRTKYHADVSWAVNSKLIEPVLSEKDVVNCVYCNNICEDKYSLVI